MVLGETGCRRRRKAHPEELRKCGSLEWPAWGTFSCNRGLEWARTTFLAQEDRLWTADPKAMNHILKNSCTLYKKQENVREMIALFVDRGLIWADGNALSNSAYNTLTA